jgi:hypothetical protein
MLMELFEEWLETDKAKKLSYRDSEVLFGSFFEEEFEDFDVREIICELAYQIYNMQICIEGMLEDMERFSDIDRFAGNDIEVQSREKC